MKIAFIGTHSTGKTTMLNELKKLNLPYTYHTEVVRDLINNYKIQINEDSTEETQLIFFNEYLKKLILEGNFISDRCILDALAYTEWLSVEKGNIKPYLVGYMNLVAKEYVGRYDKIFYFPIEFKNVQDGVRSTDEKFREEIDCYMLGVLERFKVPYIKVTGTVKERLKIILKEIENGNIVNSDSI
jgi:nicotinamide riboside kinase